MINEFTFNEHVMNDVLAPAKQYFANVIDEEDVLTV